MTLQAEQTVDHRIVTLLFQQGDRQELSLGFAHFTGIGIQMVNMEPVVAPLMAQIAFRLGNLVGVMRECIVNAAGVNIQVFPQVFHGNAGAFNVPARIAHTPGRIPFQGLVFKFGFGEPKDKVIFILLVGVLFHAFPDTDCQVFFIMVVKNIIFFQCGGIEIDISSGNICLSLLQQGLHHVDIIINAVGSWLYHIGALDIQLVAISKEGIGIIFCNLHDGFIFPLGALDHFVFAGIRIGCQVAYVRNIHDPLDRITQIPQ